MRHPQIGNDGSNQLEALFVVLGDVIHHPTAFAVGLGPAEGLIINIFADGCFHQRWTGQVNRARSANDDGLVAHRWHIRPSGRARTHDGCDLGNALGREPGLVVEDAAEVIPIGEDLRLQRQKGTAGVNQVHTGQTIFGRNLLGAQMLFDRQRKIRAAFHRGIVGHNHAGTPRNVADATHHPRTRYRGVVHPVGGERRHFQEHAAGIDQLLNAVSDKQFAAGGVFVSRFAPPPS